MSRKQLLLLGVVIAVGFVLVWGILSALRGFSEYKQSILSPSFQELAIELVAPAAGQTGLVGAPVHLVANAYGGYPIESIIFWVNDVPIGAQPAAGEDPLAATALFPWVPTETGSYVIFARVQAAGGRTADSGLLIFEVLPGSKTVDPQPLAADPGYTLPPSNAGGTGQSQGWAGSIGGWLSPPAADSNPAAPGLGASVNGCEVSLNIYDNSDNEIGFRVYRSLPNIPGWSLIDSLAANDSLAVLTYTTSGYHGPLGFKVAAFNGMGEIASNPVTVEVDPADCPSVELPVLSLQVSELHALVPLDQAYCYFSLDGAYWMRWPQAGFLPVGENGFEPAPSDLFSMLDGSQVQMLLMDCWGWQGGELLDLGQFAVDGIGGAGLGQIPFGNDFIQGLLEYGQASTKEGGLFEGEYSMFLPVPVLSFSDDVNDCLANIDPSSNIPYNYCLEADGETLWPFMPSYITWDITNNCEFGPNCVDFDNPELMSDPALANAEIGYRVYAMSPAGLARTFDSPDQRVFMVPGVDGFWQCREEFDVFYRVSSYLIPQGSQIVFESGNYWFAVPEPCPAVSGAVLRVVPEILYVGNPVEESNEGQMLDLYGVIFMYTGFINDLRAVQFGAFDEQIKPGCPMPDSTNEAGGAAFNGKCPISNGWGVDLNQAQVCPDAGLNGCMSSFVLGGNQVEMQILEGEGLTISISVYDYDVSSADDLVCFGQVTLPGYVLGNWLTTFDSENLSLEVAGPNGTCMLQFSVEELLQFTN